MFIVTSVISPTKAPLDYTHMRSVFSSKERLEQTYNTIESIRKNTNEKILLVECSNYEEENIDLTEIIKSVDIFIDLSKQLDKLNISNSPHKSYSECVMLDEAADHVPHDKRVYKISGRYWLNDNFNIEDLNKGDFCSCVTKDNNHNRCYANFQPERCFGPVFSMRNKNYLKKYTTFCLTQIYNKEKNRIISQEETLHYWSRHFDYCVVDKSNSSGKISVNGNLEIY